MLSSIYHRTLSHIYTPNPPPPIYIISVSFIFTWPNFCSHKKWLKAEMLILDESNLTISLEFHSINPWQRQMSRIKCTKCHA